MGDEGTLSTSSYASSGATCFWQNVLYAEGATESNGSVFDKTDIDGNFGANTAYATKKLQSRWGLSPDGLVGGATLSKVDAKRTWNPDIDGGIWVGKLEHNSTTSDGRVTATYRGSAHSFVMVRGASTGRWVFQTQNYDGGWVTAGYRSHDC